MLDKLKADFDGILELVKKCPEPLRETALKSILDHWFAANAAPAGGGRKRQESKDTDKDDDSDDSQDTGELADGAKKFMSAQGVSAAQMEAAFQPVGTGAHLMLSPIPGSGKALRQINLAILLCTRQLLEGHAPTCTLKELREMALHYDCYDSANFSKNLKTHKKYFKNRAKGADLELVGPGFKKAAELIKAAATAS